MSRSRAACYIHHRTKVSTGPVDCGPVGYVHGFGQPMEITAQASVLLTFCKDFLVIVFFFVSVSTDQQPILKTKLNKIPQDMDTRITACLDWIRANF